jgi:hypothetical protein
MRIVELRDGVDQSSTTRPALTARRAATPL